MPGMGAFIALICFYKFGDSMVAALIGPFMRDAGLSKEMIALMKGTVGSVASLAGAALGGWYAFRGRPARRAAGLRSAADRRACCSTSPLRIGHRRTGRCSGPARVAEHLLGGMATVALFTLMMDASDPEHAGTDYTLLACAIVLAMGLANFTGAAIADAVGYAPDVHGRLRALACIGCLVLVRSVDCAAAARERLQPVWQAA
ncbi:MAG: hypothetical protein MZV49_06050 [Rhodopseudomonas palustris]|nr:hypothetical protein [Rhodopseudomonas palustris]